MKRFVMLLMAVILMMSGCKYSSEPDEKSYVTAIGIDKGEKYPLRFTFIFASPAQSGSKNEDKSDNDETVAVEAPSLYSAIEQMNGFKSKTVELTHTQTIVFSEELAKEGIKEYIYMLVRSDNFRPNIYICIADKSAMDFLDKINHVQTHYLEKFFQLIFKKRRGVNYSEMYLYDTYFDLLSENKASILPYCSINKKQIEGAAEIPSEPEGESTEEPSEEDGGRYAADTDDFAINIIAGGTMRRNDNPSEIQGAAVLKDGVYVTVLGKNEDMAVQLIDNGFPDSYITVSDPNSPDNMITVFLSQNKKTKVDVETEKVPKISVKIDLEGDFTSLGTNNLFLKDPKLFEDYLEGKIKEEVIKLLEKTVELDCDICSFSEDAKKCFSNVADWKNYDWLNKYKDAEFAVDVNITMRTYGELSQNA